MAATIYEPLSTAHLKLCTVDFDSRPDKKAVNLVQYDQTIPVLCVSLKKGGTEYKVPSDADVNIRMDKRDGYHVYNPALGVNAERTIAYFAVTPQMSTGWGDYYPIVEITVGGGIAGSAPIWLHFDRNPLPENAIISSDEYKTIQQLLEDVTAVKAATEQIKAQTEAVRDQAKGFADNAKNSADKAQTLVDGMPSDYSQAMKDIGTLKNQMQRAYPNDSTIGENPWSSKNIVDMLCPPIEESSNPVVCYPVAGYPLGVKAKWEPTQEGSGTPSPENIRPIKGRDSVTVNRTDGLRAWKALTLDGTEKWSNNGPVASIKKQEWAAYKILEPYPGTFGISSHFSDIKDSSVYPFNYVRISSTSIVFGVALDGPFATLDAWKSYLAAQYAAGTPVQICYKLAEPVVVPDTNGIFFSEQPVQVGSGNPSPDNIRPILLNNAVQVGQTNVLTLPETVYGGEVDAVTGEGTITKSCFNLDDATNWEDTSYTENNDESGYGFMARYPGSRGDGKECWCSHLPYSWGITSGRKSTGILVHENGQVYVRVKIDGVNSVETWIAYLAAQKTAGTPVQACYKLGHSVPFTATGAKPLPAIAGVNTVLTDADSATVTGRADPIKRITDLEAAVASIN